ncbi:MAG: signal peptidase II [Clostridia bacterium]|nr:signal peptidase II [Clostridia bacterium]
MLLWFFVIVGAVILDQLSKWLIVTYLPDGGVPIIDGVLRFTYVENRGAAFGMLSEHRWVFIIVSTVALAALAFYLFKYKPEGWLARCSISFIIGGGIGNMIDRVLLGYVIDFIDFCAFPEIWMWVFNVADSFVCVGAGMLMLYLVLSTVKEVKQEKAIKAKMAQAEMSDSKSEQAADEQKTDHE